MMSPKRAVRDLSVFLFAVFISPVVTLAQHYTQTNLVSDLAGQAKNQDPNLRNPWGLTRSSGSPWWVANNGSGTSTLYSGAGDLFPTTGPLVVTLPPPKNAPAGTVSKPTGTVFNGSSDFSVATGKAAIFIFVTLDGTISGWNPTVDPTHAILVVDNSGKAVYTGVTIAVRNGKRFLYVANFKSGRVEVYDASFQRVHDLDHFFDDADDDHDGHGDHQNGLGFAPFNVQNVGGNLVVTYAKQSAAGPAQDGPGLGFVNIFSPGGRFLARLEHGSWFDAPWGVALSPRDFGTFSHSLLIGNLNNGKIAAFNAVTFQFEGFLKNPDDSPIVIERLWALGFGNGGNAGPGNSLFFTAGINGEADGLFGTLTAVAAEQDGSVQ
jgi:uncharacterized protein (TIGR03118 family)